MILLYKTYKAFIYFFLLLAIASCSLNQNEQPGSKSFILNTESPDFKVIKLMNRGYEQAVFKMKINNNLFYNDDDLLNEIKQMEPEFPDESLERKTWRFVKDNSRFNSPLTEETWQHSPSLFINSIGFGYCDDRASVLSFLWQKAGFTSRVWNLGGHVVAEVYIDNKWQMYDADFEIYYHNDENKIASVAELADNPSIILESYHMDIKCKDIISKIRWCSNMTVKLYSSKENNSVSDWYSQPVVSNNLEFRIPPGAVLEFPAVYENNLMSSKLESVINYANAKLTLPTNWKGSIKIPLVVHAIKGQGKVRIEDILFEIGSEELNDHLNDHSKFIFRLAFEDIIKPIEIIYLLNPNMMQLKKENLLHLQGYNLDNIIVELDTIPESFRINLPDFRFILEKITDFEKNMDRIKKINELEDFQINSKKDFYKKAQLFIYGDTDLSEKEKPKKFEDFQVKLKNILTVLNQGIQHENMFKAMEDDSYFVFFISLFENLSEEEITELILHYYNEK
ncbi:MAG: hypothetical protein ABII90_02415 [Bacteroidota bacterium]